MSTRKYSSGYEKLKKNKKTKTKRRTNWIMHTLVGEGIGAFIVVGHEHSLIGLEVFSF